MNTKQRYGTFVAITFAATLVATLALVPIADQQAFARPQPAQPVGDHVMKINLKGVPNDTDRACDQSSSKNIYMPSGTDDGEPIPVGHQHIRWMVAADSNVVVDHCTEDLDGDYALALLSEGTYVFTIRMLGPPDSSIRFCSQDTISHELSGGLEEEGHCVLDTVVVREKGKPTLTMPKSMFYDDYEDIIWSIVGSEKFRNAQIDIWEAAE